MNPCDVRFQDHSPMEDVPVEAVVAGTMCLMSCAMQTGSMMYVRKIVDNLDLLASSANLSGEMRSVCRKLAGHWQCALDDVSPSCGSVTIPVVPSASNMQ